MNSMQNTKRKLNCKCLYLALLAFVLFGVQNVGAQSGRLVSVPTPSPTPNVITTTKETAATDDETSLIKPSDVSISTLLVAGEIIHDNLYYKSNDLDNALKECARYLRESHKPVNATKIGKLNYTDAKERAKTETDAYVLWISFVSKTDGYGNMRIDYADYGILMPKTGKRLMNGRIKAGERSVVATGGILGLPQNRTRSSAAALRLEMREIVRQIPEILIHGGWLGR
jgi:hypothetical protein